MKMPQHWAQSKLIIAAEHYQERRDEDHYVRHANAMLIRTESRGARLAREASSLSDHW
jgi:hypothetical protein